MAEKKEAVATTKTDYSTWSVYKKLAKARAMVQAGGMQRTGKHRHVNKSTGAIVEYKYFELADFLPKANLAFDEVGLCSSFRIIHSAEGDKQMAVLTVVNSDRPEEFITFSSDTARVEMQTAIQSLGALHTYMRRYLWIEALEIVENDMVDAPEEIPEEPKIAPKSSKNVAKQDAKQNTPNKMPCTVEQIRIIADLAGEQPDRFEAMKKHYGIEKVQELTMVQASEAIKALQTKKAEA